MDARASTGAKLNRIVHQRAALEEDLAQHRAVAAGFIGTITTDGEVGLMGQRRENIQRCTLIGRGHFRPVLFHEAIPVPFRPSRERLLDQCRARRQRRQPDIVEILRGILRLPYASRRASHGAETKTFPGKAVGT